MDKPFEAKRSRKSVQRLAESIRSLLGFKTHPTSSWAESVCHIIKQLPSDDPFGGSRIFSPSFKMMDSYNDKESEMDETLVMIRGDLAALNAYLDQLNLWRRQALNDFQDLKGNIRVFCRIRPLLVGEKYRGSTPVIALDSSNVLLQFTANKRKQYSFDKVFHPGSSQDEVFSEVEPVIKSTLDGYNACIFVYGQTGTGKTFTMEGRADCPGVVPCAIEVLFKQALDSNHTFLFTFSMLEIYMGNLRDLLVPQNVRRTDPTTRYLPIKMDPNGGIEIDNLVAIRVSDYNQAHRLYRLGSRFRSTASTNSNETSSRSHCLTRIAVTCYNAPERQRETSKIWMIDLGGSERLLKTQASGRRLEEGKAINLSLSALGDVISALQRKKSHVPYRNSKLTQVLRDSLGEDSKTLMLVHVSPKEEDLCETVCSLGFATRVRSIHLGQQESTEIRAQKGAAMAELLLKVNNLESARRDVNERIGKLNEKLKRLTSTDPWSNEPLETSYMSQEKPQYNIDGNKPVVGITAEASLVDLPRFMRPTASSQQKSGHVNPGSSRNARKKMPHPARKASSVCAESVTLPKKRSQSECGSDVVGSIWTCSADCETECTQVATECDVKMLIFPKQEKSSTSSACSTSFFGPESIHECKNKWADRSDTERHLTVDNWLRLQKHEPATTNIHRNKHVLGIPMPEKRSRPHKQNHENTVSKAPVLDRHITTTDVELVYDRGYGAHGNDFMEKNLHKETIDKRWSFTNEVMMENRPTCSSNHRIEKSELVEERQVHPRKHSHCTDVANNQYAAMDEADQMEALLLNGNVMREISDMGDLRGSPQHMEDIMRPCLYWMKSRRALVMPKDIMELDPTITDCVVPTIEFQAIEENRGICYRFGRIVQSLWTCALLGLGIQNIGLGHDFFYGLLL